MFDKLVESTNEKRQGRAGRIFFLTALVYGMLLSSVAVATILGLNPTLAESLRVIDIAPPIPLGESLPPPSKTLLAKAPTTAPLTAVPINPPPIADPKTILEFSKRPQVYVANNRICPGCPTSDSGLRDGVIGGSPFGEALPEPPPAPKPKPTPEPEAKPTPPPILKVSMGVAQGMAIRKVSPQFPAIARAARQSGVVQVQVLISEEGRVLEANIVSGPPLLRDAAREAARQWVFKPTTLSEVPVKVQGILTFNFTLN